MQHALAATRPHLKAGLLGRGHFSARQSGSFMSRRKKFHLNFSEMRRVETRRVVKTQQFMMCMNRIADAPKDFFAVMKPFVCKVFAISGNPLKKRWRRRC